MQTITDSAVAYLRIIIAGIALTFVTEVKAQYDVLFSHYYDMETSFNPAAAGKNPKLNITAAYAMDLAGYEHNPQTAYVAADMPFLFLGGAHGVGAQFMSDKLGLFDHMRISLQYANKQKLFGGELSIGVQASLLSEKFDGSGLDLEDSSDPAFTSSEVNGNGFDLGAGIYYKRKQFYVGVSALHLTSPKIELGEVNELQIDPTYYLTAGYAFKLRNPLLSIMTSAIGRTDGVAYRADITGRLVYQNDRKYMYGGLSYSPTNSVTALLGMRIHGVNISYSYECYTSGVNPGNGSHELFVGYQIDLNLVKRGKNVHKAVRIL